LGQFAQVNSLQNEQMLMTASEWVADFRGSFYLDLYAGSGNFTLKLAKLFKDQGHPIKTHAVEYSKTLVKRLKSSLSEEPRLDVSVTEGDVEQYLKETKIPHDSLIILDPPRAGASRQTLELIAQIMPQRLIYVSCHPVSLARDIKILAEFHARANSTRTQKKLKLRKVQGFEMFPQTDHVETMIELSFD
ncbi:MAG TPA: RNA methyltransferase, partial [Pseudobdellovibrionaceae bacterium]|nr:RNA methyltransferase [Pseudobdellovibrionaceae bacterium]